MKDSGNNLETFLEYSENILELGVKARKVLDVSLKTILFIPYLAGKWPFTRVKNNVYEITQWFTGHKGPALEGPGTTWYVKPFIKKVKDENGKIVEVLRQPRDFDFELEYATQDGLSGKLKRCQFTYLIPSKKDAKQYYWTGSRDIGRVEDMIFSYITEEIGKRQGKNLIGELSKVSENVLFRLKDKQEYIRKIYGVEIKKISLGSPDWSKEAEEILSRVFREKQEADARIIRAQSQLEEARIQAESTKDRADKYIEAAKKYAENGSNLPIGDIALELQRRDNDESIAGKPNINAVFSVPSNYGGNNAIPIIPLPLKNKSPPNSTEADSLEKKNNLEPETNTEKTSKETIENILTD